jgi:hypothetical protein
MMRHPVSAVCLLLLAGTPAMARAQREGPTVQYGVLIGAARYDLSATSTGGSTGFSATGFSFRAGITIPLVSRVVFIEPSLGFLSARSQFGKRSAWMFPEMTVQAQRPRGAVHPYLGVGLGAGTMGLSGPARWKFTMLGLGGVRVHLTGQWGVRGEVRVRSVDPWNGHTADFGVGFTHTSF